MKSLIYILVVVSLVVAISGCTSDIWATNKTFSGSGISFTYPGAWSEENQNTMSSFTFSGATLVTLLGNNDYTLAIYTMSFPQTTSQQNQQLLQSYKSNMSSVQGGTKTSDKDITIDGTQGAQVDFKNNEQNAADQYVSMIVWFKNGKAYLLAYGSRNNDTQTLDKIISTIVTT